MKKIFCLFLAFCFFSSTVYAEEAAMITVNEGQKAPFSGTLLNSKAAAEIILKLNSSEENFKLRLDKELKIKEEICNHKIGKLKLSQNFEIDIYKSQVDFLKNQVNLSVKQLKKNDFSSELWFAGGFITGALLVLGISYVTIKMGNQ